MENKDPLFRPFLGADPNETNGFETYRKSVDKAFRTITNFENLSAVPKGDFLSFKKSSISNSKDNNSSLFGSGLSPIRMPKVNDIRPKSNINNGKDFPCKKLLVTALLLHV